jgi:hypothetical protein
MPGRNDERTRALDDPAPLPEGERLGEGRKPEGHERARYGGDQGKTERSTLTPTLSLKGRGGRAWPRVPHVVLGDV